MGKKHRSRAVASEAFADSPVWSIGDPAFAEWLRMSGYSAGTMDERKAASLSAWYRAEALVAGTIAGFPLKVYRDRQGGEREEVEHFLSSDPAGPFDLTAFSWVEMLVLHLMNHGEAYLKAIHNEGGELIGLWPVHPLAVQRVRWDGPDKVFTLALQGGGTEDRVSGDIVQILGMSFDGLRGESPLSLFRRTLNTTDAADQAANRAFTTGALISGLVTTEEDVDGTEAEAIKDKLNAKVAGPDSAGDIAFVNRNLRFTPWKMSNVDAQFLESRIFQVEEVSRIHGVPPHLLMSTSKITSWGAGIAEQDLALAKYTLMTLTGRIEAALRRVLPPGHFAEFEYKGLLQGTPAQEIELLITQVDAGLLTLDEARAILNRPPIPAPAPAPAPAPEPAAA